jgi:porin
VVNSETGNRLAHDWGLYVVGDHQLTASGDEGKGLSAFYQLGVSRATTILLTRGGLCLHGVVVAQRGRRTWTAMARGLLTKERGKDETSVELTYKAQLTDTDLFTTRHAVIIHPGGTMCN